MQYVKFGSRRGEHGDIKLLDIFYKHNIVFAEVKAGVEKVKEKKFLKGTRIIIAAKVKIYKLKEEDYFPTTIGKFYHIKNKDKIKLIDELLEKYSN